MPIIDKSTGSGPFDVRHRGGVTHAENRAVLRALVTLAAVEHPRQILVAVDCACRR